MAKKQKQSEDIRYAVNKKALKKAQARAAQEQAKEEKRVENREKNSRMSSAFLYGVFALIAAFCLYTLLRTLLVRRAASLEELRGNLLFVSLAAIPGLLACGAILVHRLLKTRRSQYSDRGRRMSNLLFLLVLLAAFVLFGVQLRGGLTDASIHPVYAQTLDVLEKSGLELTASSSVDNVKTLLEESLRTDLLCGNTIVRLNYHVGKLPSIPERFLDQAAWDYEDCPLTESGDWKIWSPAGPEEASRAAAALRTGSTVRILELLGPKDEIELLLSLFTTSDAG